MKSFFFIIIVCFNSCSNHDSVITKQLSESDSLVINFNIPQTDSIAKTITTTESKAINKLIMYADAKTAEACKCRYDGNLMFYKNSILVGDVSFNYSGDGCRHFIMLVNDKLILTAMSNEAADFLKSLAEGQGYY